jgi:hypothetical protein
MVTHIAWMVARLVSLNREMRYASAASWGAIMADNWKWRLVCNVSDFTDKTLEGELPDEELSRFLVTNFMKSNCSRAQMVGLLDTTSCVLQTDQR